MFALIPSCGDDHSLVLLWRHTRGITKKTQAEWTELSILSTNGEVKDCGINGRKKNTSAITHPSDKKKKKTLSVEVFREVYQSEFYPGKKGCRGSVTSGNTGQIHRSSLR